MAISALKVCGPYKGPSGYDHHVREFVRELHRLGVAVQLEDFPEWSLAKLPTHLRDSWFDTLDRPTGARVVLHFLMPHQVRARQRQVNVNYTMFEATRVPPAWVTCNQAHDLLVVPTDSSRRAWLASGMPEERIRLCPLGVNPALFAKPATPMALRASGGESLAQYRARFLNVSELGPRKNLLGLLRGWLRATSRDDDAVLIIKLGCYVPGWRELFERHLEALQAGERKRLDEAAPVHVIDEVFSDADMPRLYAAATHYISVSFGEGWDQAMVEAAASGLSLIAPNHSAYTTYLDASVARLIPSREVPAAFPPGSSTAQLFRGANWWQPDEEAAVAFIRAAIDGRDSSLGSARDRILRSYTWEAATRRLITLLSEAEARGARPSFWSLLRSYTSAGAARTPRP